VDFVAFVLLTGMPLQEHHRKGCTLIGLHVVIVLMATLVLLLSPVPKSASLKSGAVASAQTCARSAFQPCDMRAENGNQLPHGRWSGDITNSNT